MVDQIVELEDGKSYVMLDSKELDNRKFYYGLRVNENEEPTNEYLFFEEFKEDNDTYLLPIDDESLKTLLLTVFTTNYIDSALDM